MSYPKPWSEKTIAKKYAEAGIDEEKKELLGKLFDACANLCGIKSIQEIWEVYETCLKDKVPVLKKRDILQYSSIARREKHIYRIYEIDELYAEEERKEERRLLVNKGITFPDVRSRYYIYRTEYGRARFPGYYPEDILAYADRAHPEEYDRLVQLIGSMETGGKKLRDMRMPDLYEGEKDESPAERIVREFRMGMMTGGSFAYLRYVFYEELRFIGADFADERQERQAAGYMKQLRDRDHRWCMDGWSPEDFNKAYPEGLPASDEDVPSFAYTEEARKKHPRKMF